MKIEPPSLNSGSAFCTVNSVPRAFSQKASSKSSSVISPSLLCAPRPGACPQHVDRSPFPVCDRVEQTVQIVEVGRIALHASQRSADQFDGLFQLVLPSPEMKT